MQADAMAESTHVMQRSLPKSHTQYFAQRRECTSYVVSELLHVQHHSVSARRTDRELIAWNVMYDFCFTFPYSFLLALGGLIGFATKGSLPSLVGGLGSAGILAASGYVSLQQYHQGKLCR